MSFFVPTETFYLISATTHQMHFAFNVSYLSGEEDVLEAEFHLFKLRPQNPDSTGRPGVAQPHVVDVSQFFVTCTAVWVAPA